MIPLLLCMYIYCLLLGSTGMKMNKIGHLCNMTTKSTSSISAYIHPCSAYTHWHVSPPPPHIQLKKEGEGRKTVPGGRVMFGLYTGVFNKTGQLLRFLFAISCTLSHSQQWRALQSPSNKNKKGKKRKAINSNPTSMFL